MNSRVLTRLLLALAEFVIANRLYECKNKMEVEGYEEWNDRRFGVVDSVDLGGYGEQRL